MPGNLEIDLMNAGKMQDPYFGGNHADRSNEYLHCFYFTEFEYDGSLENPSLFFEGLDTLTEIYLNGKLIGTTDNMLIEHELAVSDALKFGKNQLEVHFLPVVIEARKYPFTLNNSSFKYNSESLRIRKAPHMFSWDIAPRLVSCGIWKPCYLIERKPDRITEFYAYTARISEDHGSADVYCLTNVSISRDEIEDYSLSVKAVCGDSKFEFTNKLYNISDTTLVTVKAPKLWWPRFSGEPALYDVIVTLMNGGEVLDEYKTKLGIRTAELERSSVTDAEGNGQFRFVINGRPINVMGTNWVPADALHSRDAERIPKMLPMLDDLNCNMMRLWGGNVYENDMLYDYCDEHGIMLWQDFIMGCASYPQDEEFQKKLGYEATVAVKRLRQHPSIVAWAGDNEGDCSLDWDGQMKRDPNANVLTRKVLPEVLRNHDFSRPYLPSSPYWDEEKVRSGKRPPEEHLWAPYQHFKDEFYTESTCHFVSEIGRYGCVSPKNLEKFLPKDKIWTSEESASWRGIDNDMWMYHSSCIEGTHEGKYTFRIMCMAQMATYVFGKTVPNNLCDFAKASQIAQAEGVKFFIEHFRVTRPRRTGILWWNLMDSWPTFSDAIVDYYFTKKLAYHYIKRSQNPVCLIFDEPKNGILPLYAVSEYPDSKKLSFTVTNLTTGEKRMSGSAETEYGKAVPLGSIRLNDGEKSFYLIEWECDGKKYSNHYMTNIADIDYKEYLDRIEECGYSEFEGF